MVINNNISAKIRDDNKFYISCCDLTYENDGRFAESRGIFFKNNPLRRPRDFIHAGCHKCFCLCRVDSWLSIKKPMQLGKGRIKIILTLLFIYTAMLKV